MVRFLSGSYNHMMESGLSSRPMGAVMKTETFEKRLAQAKEKLEKLMDPDITLEESVKLYEEGLKEIKEAQDMLEEAKMKIAVIDKESQQVEGV